MAQEQLERLEISAQELKDRLDRGDALVVLDVRNADEFASWKVDGRHAVPMANVPYFDFIEDPDAAIAQMPFTQDDAIVVVCAKGGSSEFVANELRERGYRAINLTGGMTEWGQTYTVRTVEESDQLTLLQFDRFGKGCVSYMVASGDEAIVVDPGRHFAQYAEEAAKRGWRIGHIYDTHLHADHISGAPELAESTGGHYHLHEADAHFGPLTVEGQPGRIQLGSVVVDVLQEHTPGHTPGSTSLVVDGKYLISGDTLFVNSVGRPDLGGHAEEWAHDLYWTLVNKIQRLPDETIVLPGHYSSSAEAREDGVIAGRLGTLRAENEALNLPDEEAFVAFIQANMRPSPEIYGTIRKVNLKLEAACEDQRTALELGKNECAASRARST